MQDVELVNRKFTVRKGDRAEININFNTMRVDVEGSGNSFQLIVYAINPDNIRKFYFEAPQQEDAELWRHDLNKAIEGSDGKQYPLSYLTGIEEYWRVSLPILYRQPQSLRKSSASHVTQATLCCLSRPTALPSSNAPSPLPSTVRHRFYSRSCGNRAKEPAR